ncbi:MAG: MASE3 domain-containing protein [Methanobacteriota archaeon]
MNRNNIKSKTANLLILSIISLTILIGLYLISLQNYLLFHGIVELAGIAVAFCIFLIIWNTRRIITSTFFLITGISFLFVGSIDLFHTLAYKGMGVFPGASADLPSELWIAARAFQSITFFIATLYIGRSITKNRRYDTDIIIVVCTLICSVLYASIFVFHNFPSCFIEGSGLTPFKIISEYIISAIFIATIIVLYVKRRAFVPEVWQLLAGASMGMILGELAFTSYISVYGFMNMLGHLFRLISVYLFYRAIVVVALTQPYNLLFWELKENEKALQESETRFRSLFDHMEEGNALHELVYDDHGQAIDYQIIAVNPGYERIFSVCQDDVIGKNSRDTCDAPEPPHLDIYSRIEQSGQAESFEEYYPDQEKYMTISAYSPKKGQFATMFTDITHRRQAEKALHQLIIDYRTILENVPAMIWYKDTENNFIRVNSAAAATLGRSISDIEGKSTSEIFPDSSDSHYLDDREIISTGKEKLDIIEEITTASGEKLWIETDKIPLRDNYGNITGVLLVCDDIPERKKAEDALIQANKKLNLLSSITRHDIGNELQIIFGCLGFVKEKNLNPPLNEYIENAYISALNIERQIAFTRDYQDIGVHSPIWQDIKTMISQAVRTLDILPIQIHIEISGIKIYADPLMGKVFFNLVDNAKRYGETITEIKFSGFERAGGYIIICEDDGVGIPDEFKLKIFNREHFTHTGFGLNLSREILEITGITITETGEPGKGARFEIRVPEGRYRNTLADSS